VRRSVRAVDQVEGAGGGQVHSLQSGISVGSSPYEQRAVGARGRGGYKGSRLAARSEVKVNDLVIPLLQTPPAVDTAVKKDFSQLSYAILNTKLPTAGIYARTLKNAT
jgi:hypothetical protein